MKTRRVVILLAWLFGILFPMGWLRQFSPAFRQRFDAIFSPEWVHVVMHAFIFAVLVGLVFYVFDARLTRSNGLMAMSGVLWVGIFQEGFQWFTHSTVPGWNSLFDLGVDLCGALLALGLIQFYQSKMAKKIVSYP